MYEDEGYISLRQQPRRRTAIATDIDHSISLDTTVSGLTHITDGTDPTYATHQSTSPLTRMRNPNDFALLDNLGMRDAAAGAGHKTESKFIEDYISFDDADKADRTGWAWEPPVLDDLNSQDWSHDVGQKLRRLFWTTSSTLNQCGSLIGEYDDIINSCSQHFRKAEQYARTTCTRT